MDVCGWRAEWYQEQPEDRLLGGPHPSMSWPVQLLCEELLDVRSIQGNGKKCGGYFTESKALLPVGHYLVTSGTL